MITKEEAFTKISNLVERFEEQYSSYKKSDYNETLTRRDFIDPFFKALGWDVDNENSYAESYREVIHEDKVKVGNATKSPDYSFRLSGSKRLFFVEAKKPSVVIKDDIVPAYQVRRYGWSAKLAVSIITDFEEFAIYDCTKRPFPTDKASVARIKYLTFRDYLKEFDFIWNTFSKEKVLKGSFDKFLQSTANKRGTTTVDNVFLESLDTWRTYLATNIAQNNKNLEEDELNFAVQQTLDRIIFLRIAEGRGIENYGNLQSILKQGVYYQNMFQLFKEADDRYNSGLFDLKKDKISNNLKIDNKIIKNIINELYYPLSPYEFSVLSVEILGSAYEQFLGKTITIDSAHRAVIEEKPDVRKSGGVFYTPQYIVDYIVKKTIGKLVTGKTPQQVAQIKVVDPACGSGSFLLGAYQFLLDWHKSYYSPIYKEYTEISTSKKYTEKERKAAIVERKKLPFTPLGDLTTSLKKEILLNNIYGVDIDVNAVEVTKLSLLLKCMEGETNSSMEAEINFGRRVLPTLDNNIKSGNSLIDLDYYDGQLDYEPLVEKKVKPFNWQKAFPDVFNRNIPVDKRLPFKKQYQKVTKHISETDTLISTIQVNEPPAKYEKVNCGFDVIIGNPPYVKVSDKVIFGYFNNKFIHQDYQQDLYLLFLEQYKNLLIIGGKLGVIIPNTWLQSIKFRNIRKYLVNEYYWENILNSNKHIFKAVVDTHVIVFEKNNYIKNEEVKIDLLVKGEISPFQIINQNNLPDNGDVLNVSSNEDENGLFEKIKQKSISISECCVVYNGVKPFEKGKGKPAQTEIIMKEKPYVVEKKPKPKGENWLPLMRGSLMHRYSNYWNNNSWIQYGEWLAAPRDPKVFEATEKIIVRQTGDSIIATIIGEDIICRNNLHVLISSNYNHKFLLGILNSKLTDFFYRQINPEKGEVLAEVKKTHVEQLPIPKVENDKIRDEIIKNSELLLQLYSELHNTLLDSQKEQLNNRIQFSEDKINSLIYQLYELTEEEIKTVEGK